MAEFIAYLIAGLATGAIYALAAIGFTLVWQTSQTINFAQGEFVMLPAILILALVKLGARRSGSRRSLALRCSSRSSAGASRSPSSTR